MSQVLAAAQHRNDGLGELEVCGTVRLLGDLHVVVVEHQTVDWHRGVVGKGAKQSRNREWLAFLIAGEVEDIEAQFVMLDFKSCGQVLYMLIH